METGPELLCTNKFFEKQLGPGNILYLKVFDVIIFGNMCGLPPKEIGK